MAKKRKPLELFRVEGLAMVASGATLYDHASGNVYRVKDVKTIANPHDAKVEILVKARHVGTAFDVKTQLIPCKLHPMGRA